MAKLESIEVNVVANVELVSVMCTDRKCIHNLYNIGKMACNLKHIVIHNSGVCANRKEKAE